MRDARANVDSEIAQIADWWKAGLASYQIHKVLNARRFRTSNVA